MIGRPNRVAIIHSCRRWPACPNGASNVRPSPVPNPSREIEKLWTRTCDMAASRGNSDCDVQLAPTPHPRPERDCQARSTLPSEGSPVEETMRQNAVQLTAWLSRTHVSTET